MVWEMIAAQSVTGAFILIAFFMGAYFVFRTRNARTGATFLPAHREKSTPESYMPKELFEEVQDEELSPAAQRIRDQKNPIASVMDRITG